MAHGDAWQANNPAGGAVIQAGSLSYTDAKGNVLVTAGGKAYITGLNGTAQPFRELPLVLGQATATTWFSFLGQRVGPTTNNVAEPDNIYPRAANVSLFNSTLASSTEQLAIGGSTGAPVNTWALLPDGALGNRQGSPASMSNVSFLVVRIDHKDGNDDAYLWVNPALDTEPAITAADAQSLGGFDFSFNRIRPFAGNPQANNSRPHAELLFDELRVGGSYAVVAPFTAGGGARPALSISRTANDIEIRWASGTLESASSVTGPWTAVPGAAAPSHRVTSAGTQGFFRVRQ